MPLRAYGKGDRRTHIPWSVRAQMIMITMNRVGEDGSQQESVAAAVAFLRKSLGPANTLFKIFASCEQATRRHVHINLCAPNRITWVKLRKKLAASVRFPGHFNVWESSAGQDMGDRWAYACKYLTDPAKKKELGALIAGEAEHARVDYRRMIRELQKRNFFARARRWGWSDIEAERAWLEHYCS